MEHRLKDCQCEVCLAFDKAVDPFDKIEWGRKIQRMNEELEEKTETNEKPNGASPVQVEKTEKDRLIKESDDNHPIGGTPYNWIHKVYVTRYALSRGIFTIFAEITENGYAREWSRNPRVCGVRFLTKNDYAVTAEDAVKQAEEKRIKKLKSLDKQAKKIAALNFEAIDQYSGCGFFAPEGNNDDGGKLLGV